MTFAKALKFIVPAILFFAVLKSVAEDFNFSWGLVAALAAIAVSGPLLSYPKTSQGERRCWLPVAISILIAASCLIFLITLKDNASRYYGSGLFSFIFALALISANIFFSQYHRCQKGKRIRIKFLNLSSGFLKSVLLVSVFLWTVGIYGLYIDLELPVHLLMLTVLLSAVFSTRCLLRISQLSRNMISREKFSSSAAWFHSFLLGLIMVELIWAISFWPVSQLTAGAIILVNYYVFWNILENYLKNTLSKKIISSNILLLATAVILLLLSSKWEIK